MNMSVYCRALQLQRSRHIRRRLPNRWLTNNWIYFTGLIYNQFPLVHVILFIMIYKAKLILDHTLRHCINTDPEIWHLSVKGGFPFSIVQCMYIRHFILIVETQNLTEWNFMKVPTTVFPKEGGRVWGLAVVVGVKLWFMGLTLSLAIMSSKIQLWVLNDSFCYEPSGYFIQPHASSINIGVESSLSASLFVLSCQLPVTQ